MYRLDHLLGGRVIHPKRLIGDLQFRNAIDWRTRLMSTASGDRLALGEAFPGID
jgi:hypothetical protein